MPMPAATLTRRMPHYRLSPPTLSGVNCKRDRVAVDLPVSWRCRRGMPMPAATLTRRMPHYRLSPRRCRGLTANETALRSICLFLGVVGGVAASGDAHAAHAALSPVHRRCRGLTANGTALRSICLSLGVVGGVAASGTALRSKSLNKIDAPPVSRQAAIL